MARGGAGKAGDVIELMKVSISTKGFSCTNKAGKYDRKCSCRARKNCKSIRNSNAEKAIRDKYGKDSFITESVMASREFADGMLSSDEKKVNMAIKTLNKNEYKIQKLKRSAQKSLNKLRRKMGKKPINFKMVNKKHLQKVMKRFRSGLSNKTKAYMAKRQSGGSISFASLNKVLKEQGIVPPEFEEASSGSDQKYEGGNTSSSNFVMPKTDYNLDFDEDKGDPTKLYGLDPKDKPKDLGIYKSRESDKEGKIRDIPLWEIISRRFFRSGYKKLVPAKTNLNKKEEKKTKE